MIKVIRKTPTKSLNTINEELISTVGIEALQLDESVILMEPVKTSITIAYDALGKPSITTVPLGVQYDHRVTWLHFDLENLIWNLGSREDYTSREKTNFYTFKLALTNNTTGETSVWEFDGENFEIPRGLTKKAGTYKIILIIEEYQGDDFVGNIKEETRDKIERFVSMPFTGVVHPTFYDPTLDFEVEQMETDQKAALVKPSILCALTDNGEFYTEVNELGQQQDNFIRYLKFNPNKITAHLNDFYIFAIFKQDDEFHATMFEKTNPEDPLDDYSVMHPMIGWIPSAVYQKSGKWKVAIMAFRGNLQDINNPDEENGDYYFFLSQEKIMKVAQNHLTIEDVNKQPILNITSELLTATGEIIVDADGKVYTTGKR